MENANSVFDRPVVLAQGRYVKRFYNNALLTAQDGFDPWKVIMVCGNIQRTHKGEVFRFASELDIAAAEILKEVVQRG